jgi:hypothetical protein
MKLFTPEEDQFIRDNYITMSSHAMDKALGRTRGATRQRMARIGVVVPQEVIERFTKESFFKKGNVSHNKGKGMSPEIREKVKRTWFPKGHQPHNTKYDGLIVKRLDKTGRPYLYIRERVGKWELLHRHLWRKYYGEIPAGKLVVFKDGNSENCVLENLEVIDLKENMLRNTIHNLPEEIAKTKLLIGSLNRKINRHGKNNK